MKNVILRERHGQLSKHGSTSHNVRLRQAYRAVAAAIIAGAADEAAVSRITGLDPSTVGLIVERLRSGSGWPPRRWGRGREP